MCIKVQPLTLALPKCVHLPYLRYVSLMYGLLQLIIKRPLLACLCMGELPAPLAPHFVFLITL